MAVFRDPACKVFVHSGNENSIDEEALRRKVPYQGLPPGIKDSIQLAEWLKTHVKAVAALLPGGWAHIPDDEPTSLPPIFSIHVRTAPGLVDRSGEWARAVVRPFSFSVTDVAGLRKALQEPLSIPIGAATYPSLDPEVASQFFPTAEHDRIASHVNIFINSRVHIGMSENLLQSTWDMAFCNLWGDLLMLTDVTSITYNRNVVDRSGASVDGTRNDLMVWILNRLCAKFEEKRDSLVDVFKDLVKKLCALPANYYGPVDWIIGIALAGCEMAGWAMTHGQAPEDLIGRLNMVSVKDKAKCLRISINLLRVALTISQVYSNLSYLPRPFDEFAPVVYGSSNQITRKLVIKFPRVVKEILNWPEHVAEGFTTTEFVRKAYALGDVALVSGQVTVKGWHYKVVMDTVGYAHKVSQEDELWSVLRSLLEALKTLHCAGLVHRDIRWRNVLKKVGDGAWMLIDLETVWKSGQKPTCQSLLAWDDNTLDEDGRYTEQSDLYLLGKLMDSSHIALSRKAEDVRWKLLSREYGSALEALRDAFGS